MLTKTYYMTVAVLLLWILHDMNAAASTNPPAPATPDAMTRAEMLQPLTPAARRVSAHSADAYPPVPPAAHQYGLRIQRAMRLLATSTPTNRHTVRILFYGQSITRQSWWRDVVADLHRRFPHANIVADNLAIGGFASQRLIVTAPRDLLEFYPDLLIFHVFGDHRCYENIIRLVRSMTTAEIVMQNDHFSTREQPNVPVTGWSAFMNDTFLPATAEKYDCELADVRGAWRRYLLTNGFSSAQLLSDDVHLNDHGCHLMAALVSQCLVYRPEITNAPADAWVHTYVVGRDTTYSNGRVRCEFIGNRVVALVAPGSATSATWRVLIDGRPPSAWSNLYSFTRANNGPGVDWPWHVCVPYCIQSRTPLIEEDWRITLTDGDTEHFSFRIEGSKTGPDGAGTSDTLFISRSGRVVIDPALWWRTIPHGRSSPLKPGYVITFKSELLGTDRFRAPIEKDASIEHAIVLAQGLPNGRHVLELIPDSENAAPPITLRAYAPPLHASNGD